MPDLDWNKMIDRQVAGKKFLEYLISHPKARDAALADPAEALRIFKEQSGMKLPPEVKITAIDDSRPARDNFNVILVPEFDPDPDILRYWIAAWIPYDDGTVRSADRMRNG